MKTLLLLRHAKSDWNAAFGHDHERPLNSRGEKAAARMGRVLADLDPLPDLVLCSTATRTRMTLERACEAASWDPTVEYLDDLYGASPQTILCCLRSADERAESILVVGHEPGMSMTLSLLLGEAPTRYPTAALACIDLDLERWSSVGAGTGTLRFFIPPRMLSD